MEGSRILVLILGIGLCFGDESQSHRSTRTIARFFGLESNSAPQPQQVQQQVQPRKPVPLVYSVKYYDRTGEGEKVEVIPEHGGVDSRVQGVPARVFLNLYTGQQTPVYYDNKGQILVPCPMYDHLYVAGVDQPVVRKPSPSKVVQSPVVPPPAPQVHPVVAAPEIVYYASPSFVGNPNPVPQQKAQGVTVVGLPYDYPYYPGLFPYGGGYNPYVYIQPPGSSPGHSHHVISPSSQVPVEKKEGDKTD